MKRTITLVSISCLALCALQCEAGNHIVAWGSNDFTQTNVPPSATNVIAVAGGANYSLALRSDGKVIGWGQAPGSSVPATLSNVVAIAAGRSQSFALKDDGTLVSWGSTATTNIPTGLSNIVAVSCGDDHNLVLKADGTIFAWGANYSFQTNIPAGLSNVVAIYAANSGNLAILNDGTTWALAPASTKINSISNAVVAGELVANGQAQGAVISPDGTAHAWGYPFTTNVTVVSNAVAVVGKSAFNQAGNTWILRRDGTLVGLGSAGSLGQTNVYQNLSNVLAIAMGFNHHLAIVGDGFPLPVPQVTSVAVSNDQFSVTQPTSRGVSYWLESKESLTETARRIFPPVPGDGTTKVLLDPEPLAAQRFYQIRTGR